MTATNKTGRRRVVVKVGSNVLTRPDGKLDVTRVSAIVDQLVWLRQEGVEPILVSSGAMACGRGELQASRKLDHVAQRQLYSALGQVKLIGLYYDLFREHGVHVGQVLTMKESFSTRAEYLNQRACMGVMLDNGVIPIVNENDTVSVTELMFTDNDELSGLIATMMDADTLVILSNVDGIYDGDPKSPQSKIIPTLRYDQDLSRYIQAQKSGFGRGGMLTKGNIARKVAEEGIRVIIANGARENVLPLHPPTRDSPHRVHAQPQPRQRREEVDSPQRELRQGRGEGQQAGGGSPQGRAGRQPLAGGRVRRGGRLHGGRHHQHSQRAGGDLRRGTQRIQRGGSPPPHGGA